MREQRSRYVLVCQQLLALAAVLVLLAPAARVVTLDIVAPQRTPVAADRAHR